MTDAHIPTQAEIAAKAEPIIEPAPPADVPRSTAMDLLPAGSKARLPTTQEIALATEPARRRRAVVTCKRLGDSSPDSEPPNSSPAPEFAAGVDNRIDLWTTGVPDQPAA